MMARALLAFLACVLGAAPLQASAREELLFSLNTALKTRDGAGFARCFNFRDVDAATRDSFIQIISQILAWPTSYVFTSERSGEGNPRIEQAGRVFVLNGEWKYQVHIFLAKSSRKGFVFPAGRVGKGQDLILLTIPEKSTKKPGVATSTP